MATKLREDWSPQQIAGWLKREFPCDETMRVSHETIYLTLFIQARGALKRELLGHLRRSRSIRRPRGARCYGGQGQILNAVSIRERPAEAEDRALPGHWEGDLLAGASNSHVATLVERHSRFLLLVAVEGKTPLGHECACSTGAGAASAAARFARGPVGETWFPPPCETPPAAASGGVSKEATLCGGRRTELVTLRPSHAVLRRPRHPSVAPRAPSWRLEGAW